jgi:hypothetical protein
MYRPSSPGLRLFLSSALYLWWLRLATLTQASTPTTAAPGTVIPFPLNRLQSTNRNRETCQKRTPRRLDSKEVCFFLKEVRKDIGNLTGQEGLRHFLGPLTAAGGSLVETTLLTWRRQLVTESVQHVVEQFKGKNRLGGYAYRVYYAEIGS